MDAQYILDGLIRRGMNPVQAEAFVWNFKDESGLNPGINEIAPIVPGSRGGFGLSQWTGPRRRALEAYASSQGRPVDDADLQLDFLMTELQGPEKSAWDRISAAQTTPEAAAAVVNYFLRPAEEHRARREANYLGGEAPEFTGNALAAGGPGQMPPQNQLRAPTPEDFGVRQTALDPAAFMRQRNQLAFAPINVGVPNGYL